MIIPRGGTCASAAAKVRQGRLAVQEPESLPLRAETNFCGGWASAAAAAIEQRTKTVAALIANLNLNIARLLSVKGAKASRL
jgi:trimethylamine:corrinoid methyltransferase-like protein